MVLSLKKNFSITLLKQNNAAGFFQSTKAQQEYRQMEVVAGEFKLEEKKHA